MTMTANRRLGRWRTSREGAFAGALRDTGSRHA